MMTTTTLHFYNSTDQEPANKLLIFLQHTSPQDYDMYAAWRVLELPGHGQQSVELTTSFSASIAPFGKALDLYSDPLPLPSSTHPLEIVNADDGRFCIGGLVEDSDLNAGHVGLKNRTATPRMDVSVLWYVCGALVAQTNNTRATMLRPGQLQTFALQPYISILLSAKVRRGPFYPASVVQGAQKFALQDTEGEGYAPNLYFELCTATDGSDCIQEMPEAAYRQVVTVKRRTGAMIDKSETSIGKK